MSFSYTETEALYFNVRDKTDTCCYYDINNMVKFLETLLNLNELHD